MEKRMSAFERYERGLVLKQVQIFDSALEDFGQAAKDPLYAGKAHVQMALCLRATGRSEEAVVEFRRSLESSTFSSKERVHVLYLLGQTLESLGRHAEALEAYGWVRQEDAGFRDVAQRIRHLCAKGRGPMPPSLLVRQFRVGDILNMCGNLRRRSLSLLEQTRKALSPPPGKEQPGRSTPQQSPSLRRNRPLVSSDRPLQPRHRAIVTRQHARIAIQCRSQFSSNTQRVAGEGELRDLSPGGCRVTSSVVVPVGAELVCWIFPHNAVHPFAIEGATVRWSHAKEFGVAFTNVQPGVQRQIAQLCAHPR